MPIQTALPWRTTFKKARAYEKFFPILRYILPSTLRPLPRFDQCIRPKPQTHLQIRKA
jgi:hypothetical protein